MPMHEFAERGVASHWKYKSSEKFNFLSWKEYDWLKDLVEIIEKNENPEHSYEYTKLQMFQENTFCFTPKGSVTKTGKARAAIRRYWHERGEEKEQKLKKYNTT